MKPEISEYVKRFGLDQLLGHVQDEDQSGNFAAVDPKMTTPYLPDWEDLTRLHRLILERRVTTVLEFGCGYSTVVMAHALHLNQIAHRQFVSENLRRGNAFELHSVDDMDKYVELTSQRIPKELKSHVSFKISPVHMTTFADRICTEYESLPNICPDFIYLDAPSQDSALGNINGITTAHFDRLPMSCDILKIEHFLLPGTMIVVDGRTANARFLKANFQRNWSHNHDIANDIHTFEMIEEPLGSLNDRQIKFSLGESWPNQSRS